MYKTDSHSHHRNVEPVASSIDKALRGHLVSANDGDVSDQHPPLEKRCPVSDMSDAWHFTASHCGKAVWS
jgi:hypothetical protein